MYRSTDWLNVIRSWFIKLIVSADKIVFNLLLLLYFIQAASSFQALAKSWLLLYLEFNSELCVLRWWWCTIALYQGPGPSTLNTRHGVPVIRPEYQKQNIGHQLQPASYNKKLK